MTPLNAYNMNHSAIFAFSLCLMFIGAYTQNSVVGAPKAGDGCVLWDDNHLYCMSCDLDALYFRVKSSCVRCGDTHCDRIDDKGNCIACEQGYYLRNGKICVVVTHIPGCATYSSDAPTTICLACSATTLLVNNRCLKRVPNCDSYIPGTNLCARCAPGFTQSADWTTCVTGSVGNCLVYDCLGLCVQCNEDFPRLSTKRNLCLVEIDFCLTYLGDQNLCKICYDGYAITTDKKACLPDIFHCTAYVDSTWRSKSQKCKTCATGYYVAEDALSCVPTIPHCQTINFAQQICDLCEPGYLVTDDLKACFPQIDFCYKYEASNKGFTHHKCCNCIKGYQINADQTKCDKYCDAGFSLCPATNECVQIPVCCATHDSCGQCLTYLPTYSFCPILNTCVLIPEECPNNHNDCGQCVCATGSTWCANSRTCIAIPECCETWNNCGQCLTFKQGWSFCLDQGICVRIPDECPLNHDNCGKCACPQFSTWCLEQKSCVPVPECCDTYDNCGNCLTLLPSYTWCTSINFCVSAPIECPNSSDNCGGCDCPANYSWCSQTQRCVEIPVCCESPDGCGKCLSLKPNYTWCELTQTCNTIPLECPNDHDDCGNCVCQATGYAWCPTQKACVRIPECCAAHDNCGNCTALKPGFTWCPTSNSCAVIPAACPNDFNLCGGCECTRVANTSWCAAQQKCVPVPACCETHNNCGGCLTLKAGFLFCTETNTCVDIPTLCPTSYDSCGRCICPSGQSWCSAQSKCVAIPSCCAGHDTCGQCTGFIAGTTWCPTTNACSIIPAECPNNHNSCGQCVCTTPGFSWCSTQKACVNIPDCCETHDDCGSCLTLKAGFSWCSLSNSCFPIPADCQTSHNNCGQCICDAGSSWCVASKSCVKIPDCCVQSDNCGRCLTFKAGTAWCSTTNACSAIPAECPVNHNSCGECICDAGYKWCSTQRKCIRVPSCCATDNSCGLCLTFNVGTNWCAATNACYNLPALCPDLNKHDCSTGLCLCPTGQSWCSSSNSCVVIPSCCASHDNCGRCTSFTAGTSWCALTNACYNIPADCPLSHNCQTGECLCSAGFTWCSARRACVAIPSCCDTNDNCGNCLTYKPNTGLCSLTNACYTFPVLCPAPASHNCLTGQCICPAGQTWCTNSNSCVAVPSCCATNDNCGRCLTFVAGTAWCASTNACYNVPIDCPNNHNCATGECICDNGFKWCASRRACVLVPSCCASDDSCGNCLTYNSGTGLCSLTNACYNFPTDCPLPANHNCQTLQCVCPTGQSWCAASKSCVDIPSCCLTHNNCGTCTTFRTGTSWCSLTNACYNVPADCPNSHNCQTGECLCPAGFTWCAVQKLCIAIPTCCATWNNCGGCLTYKPLTGLCSVTGNCYNFPADCPLPANHNCATGECVCPAGQTWCNTLKACVVIPSCCLTNDNCGNCLSFRVGTAWCGLTNACYNLPVDCPLTANHNCQTGECVCATGFSWCTIRKTCVAIPSCCNTHDNCGNCLTYNSGTGLCSLTNACYTFPTDCPLPANHNCQTLQCVCPTGQTWCAARKACVVIPSCCNTNDSCGTCITFKANTGWCDLTNACYNIPADCPTNHNCQTLQCTCPAGQTWCLAQKACIAIPSCCATNDNCGNCLTFNAGTAKCALTNACYNLPVDCPAVTAHNCQTLQCTCPTGFSFCPTTKACVAIPSCCVTHNNCGTCNLVKDGFVFERNTCFEIKIIRHCVIPSSDYQTCLECEFNWIPFALNTYCRIAFCVDYAFDADICNRCETGYTQTADNKACLPIVRECETYAAATFQDIKLTCIKCLFPYYLVNGQCTIPRCITTDYSTPRITCSQCISNDARNADKNICYPPIEKCVKYFFKTPSGYGCEQCEFLFEPNDQSTLCIAASFNLMGWGGGASASGSFTNFAFAMNLSSKSLAWMAFSESMSSSWSILWWVQGYSSNSYFTIRTIITENDPILGTASEKAYYFYVNNGSLALQDGFSSSGSTGGLQVPTANLQWSIKQAFETNTYVYTIQFASTGKYLSYGLTLVDQPVYFYFR